MELLIILVFICIILMVYSIKIVKKSEVMIVERIGKYHHTARAGYNILIPFVDKVRAKINIEEQKFLIPSQSIITKDKSIINTGITVCYQITDPFKAVYEIESLQRAIQYITILTLKDIVCTMKFNDAIDSKSSIQVELRNIINEAAHKWGAEIINLEITNFNNIY